MTNRREFLVAAAAGALVAGCCSDDAPNVQPPRAEGSPFRYALNPATIRDFRCSLKEQVRLCIKAGYEGIEPWLADIQKAKDAGDGWKGVPVTVDFEAVETPLSYFMVSAARRTKWRIS